MIEMVFAVLLITTADGKIIEHTPVEAGLGACLEMKRTVSKSIQAEQQQGITVSCSHVKVETWYDCVTPDTCRLRIKRIIND